jgi:hypothetical protein
MICGWHSDCCLIRGLGRKNYEAATFVSRNSLLAAALGQASALSNQVTPIQIVDHPLHVSLTPTACERPLVGGAPDTYSYAQGERPLWEFGPVSEPVSLGDVARAYRKEKGSANKAELVLEKQGS